MSGFKASEDFIRGQCSWWLKVEASVHFPYQKSYTASELCLIYSAGKTRDLFKKIRDTKETFHAKMGTIQGGNNMDLTEAEDIKKRWQKYKEELYKKDLNDPDNHDGVITHLEPDILECEVKWA